MKPVLGSLLVSHVKNVLEQRSQISSIYLTRMHSSRMRTIRCSDSWRGGGVYPSMHWTGVCVSQHALGRGVCIPACTGQGRAGVGVCIPACTGQGCVCPGGLVCPVGGGVSREVQGDVCVQGVCLCVSQGGVLGGVCPGVCVCPGECLPQCMLGYTPTPRVNRMTDRCL